MRVAFGATAIFLSITLGSQALAATVNSMSGQVLLNRGDGYRIVAGSAQGDAGVDRGAAALPDNASHPQHAWS